MEDKQLKIIYIVGSGYSGSTILGIILGSVKEIFNIGELKDFKDMQKFKDQEICTCGNRLVDCNFWSSFMQFDYNIFQPSILKKLIYSLKVLIHGNFEVNAQKDDAYLLSLIFRKVKEFNPKVEYLLDNSKTLWRLIFLRNLNNVKTKVIYIKRGIEGNISSYIKHKIGFWRGLFRYTMKNLLIQKYLKNNNVQFKEIDYLDFSKNTKKVILELENYLDISLSNYVQRIQNTTFHIASGNKGSRRQIIKKFKGIEYDNSWMTRLNRLEIFFLKIWRYLIRLFETN